MLQVQAAQLPPRCNPRLRALSNCLQPGKLCTQHIEQQLLARCRPHSYSLCLHASSCCAQSTREMPAVALLRQHLEACVQRAFNNCCLLR